MTPDQILATVMALLAAEPDPAAFPAVTAGGADARYPVTVAPCPRPLAPGEIEGRTVICGTVDVPERHDAPDERRISLAFGLYRSRSLAPAEDPVIYLHGGPGGGAVAELATTFYFLFDQYRDRRDIVTFDQRAAGLSSDMVTCFDTFEGNIFELFTGTGDDAQMETMLSNCMTELNEGRDNAAYTTPENARDVQALMRTLGYTEWNLYGVSYGTKLALEVMRTAPERTRSIVIDSVAPRTAASTTRTCCPCPKASMPSCGSAPRMRPAMPPSPTSVPRPCGWRTSSISLLSRPNAGSRR